MRQSPFLNWPNRLKAAMLQDTSSFDSTNSALRRLAVNSIASRIWQKDASLWPPESPGAEPAAEIMGWLELPGLLSERIPGLADIASGLRTGGVTDVVMMGMGGSSMTPEVLRVVFGQQPAGARLHVLDTVNPGTITQVTDDLPLETTVFAVCSKSGTTVEPLSLEKHFRSALASSGVSDPSHSFVAITDAGTPLAKRAEDGEFAHWFEAPADVGGRFSALTAFGMFPAAALGLNLSRIHVSAADMAQACQADTAENPGLQLGAILGNQANAGRDKVTLITSPGLERFGLWVEQLLAESTGKHGKGLIPVAGEPHYGAASYGADRNFIYIRLSTADNSQADSHAAEVKAAGHPVSTLTLNDLYDIGGELFRWEFAIAVASHLIGVFPFDQPHVTAAKDKARAILDSGSLPRGESAADLKTAVEQLVAEPAPGDYVAIGAFMPESDEADAAFAGLRSHITRKTGMATTFGFGPRYLHSIGQLYKDGPATIRFLGIVSHGSGDVPVPGETYTFGGLTPAQAYGDFEVMRDGGRRIQTVSLGNNSVAEIEELLRH
jgi:transaldolase/glucose-6-phosphate isomerase